VETLVSGRWPPPVEYDARAVGIAGGCRPTRCSGARLRPGAAVNFGVHPRLSPTDNAAMIAAAGIRQLERGAVAPPDLNAAASLAL
jgi:tRNA A37 threonylcarbamoyltransferase TsaD